VQAKKKKDFALLAPRASWQRARVRAKFGYARLALVTLAEENKIEM
jgi:hypothetical protein